MVGPGPWIAPPPARTPFSVSNLRFVSNSQITEPSVVECARSAPSFDPENNTPGSSVGAEINAALHPVPAGHFSAGGGWYHARWPVVSATAWRPPGFGVRISETGKYARSASTAAPHCTPPHMEPSPARY